YRWHITPTRLSKMNNKFSSFCASSCAGRCTEGYSRTPGCQCDSSCHQFQECCPDYEQVCLAELSCKGHCTDQYVRGRLCDCDPDCHKFGKCCPDFEEAKEPTPGAPHKGWALGPISAPRPTPPAYNLRGRRRTTIKQCPSPPAPQDIPEEMNLCNKKPVDGIVALQNGSLAVFRDHYYWLLNGTSPPSPQPRKISEGWHIPSPIDTVFSRCNCDGKTFFFKGSQYWRFTNDVMDAGYPKLIVKGFGGLNGKIMGALSVAHYRSRPESVHFFKEGGNVQQYIYKQKPKKCKKKVVTVNYPVYKPKTLVLRQRRFGRAVQTRPIFRSIRIRQDCFVFAGVLQPEVKITSYWRGFPKEFNSVISVPNEENGDGYDYYAFAKDNYYNLDVGSRIARPVTVQTGQTVSSAWYKCPAE
uniref:SMB domain-containing protein n=1 Tax=Naja naja TaxID=35670 RepID=A0A8C6XVY5_NAJNA